MQDQDRFSGRISNCPVVQPQLWKSLARMKTKITYDPVSFHRSGVIRAESRDCKEQQSSKTHAELYPVRAARKTVGFDINVVTSRDSRLTSQIASETLSD